MNTNAERARTNHQHIMRRNHLRLGRKGYKIYQFLCSSNVRERRTANEPSIVIIIIMSGTDGPPSPCRGGGRFALVRSFVRPTVRPCLQACNGFCVPADILCREFMCYMCRNEYASGNRTATTTTTKPNTQALYDIGTPLTSNDRSI